MEYELEITIENSGMKNWALTWQRISELILNPVKIKDFDRLEGIFK